MPLPTKTQQLTLDYQYNGLPAVEVEAKALTSTTLDYQYNGLPAVAAADDSAPPASTAVSWWAWSLYGNTVNV
jgi:hypothetical protein